MRRLSLYLAPGLAVVALLGVVLACAEESSRSAWFTAGGPLRGSLDEPPDFAPAVWKRRCLGLSWREQRPNGEWLGCGGILMGPRLEYTRLRDAQPWIPHDVPNRLNAATLAHGAGSFKYTQARVLSWRRTSLAEDALMAAEGSSSHWMLARVQRSFSDGHSAWEPFVELNAPATSVVELNRTPQDNDWAQFTKVSGWAQTETSPKIQDWGVCRDAWQWATGNATPHEFRNEVERLKRYSYIERTRQEMAEIAAKSVPFVLIPGRSVVLPEDRMAAVRNQCSRADVPEFDATFTPSAEDINALESGLYTLNPILFRGGATEDFRRPLRSNVNDYHRQYCGFVVRGRRVIYVNALRNESVGTNWRTEPFVICDGGFSAWGILFFPTERTFSNLQINGVG